MVKSIIRVCEVCGKDISTRSKKAKFCSNECTRIKYNKRVCDFDGCGRYTQGGVYCSSHRDRVKKGEINSPIMDRDGLSRKYSRLHIVWIGMHQRCENKKHTSYKNYGARGICVCERWNVFKNFLEDMGEPPNESYSIDRIDNNLGYTPGNCRWTTISEQNINSRNFKLDDILQELIMFLYWHHVNYKDIAECAGVCITTISRFLRDRGFFRYSEHRREKK